MSLKKLTRQLRREAAANPKKAAILGLLLLVALYYWGPLVRGWVAPEQASGGPPTAGGDAGTEAGTKPGTPADAASTQPQAPPKDNASSHPWTQLDEWIRQDPMTTPAEDVTGWRDPFTVVSTAATPDGQEADPGEPALVSPVSLGLELSGTLVGARRRVALIGGKAYREGQTVRINHQDRPIELKLVEVHPRRIVLEWEGERFDVAIPEQEAAGGIGLVEPAS